MKKLILVGLISLACFTNANSQKTDCFVVNEFKTKNMTSMILGASPLYFSVYSLTGDPSPYLGVADRIRGAIADQSKKYQRLEDSLPNYKSAFQIMDKINESTNAFHKKPNYQLFENNAILIVKLFDAFSGLKEIPACAEFYKSKFPENEILKQKRGFRNIKLGESFKTDGFDEHKKRDSNGEPLETEFSQDNSLGNMHDSLVGYPIYSITVRTYKDQVSFIGISVGGENGEKVDANLLTAAIERNFGKPSYSSLEHGGSAVFYGRKRFLGGDYIMDLDNQGGSIYLSYYWVPAYKGMEDETKHTVEDKRQADIDSRKNRLEQSADQF